MKITDVYLVTMDGLSVEKKCIAHVSHSPEVVAANLILDYAISRIGKYKIFDIANMMNITTAIELQLHGADPVYNIPIQELVYDFEFLISDAKVLPATQPEYEYTKVISSILSDDNAELHDYVRDIIGASEYRLLSYSISKTGGRRSVLKDLCILSDTTSPLCNRIHNNLSVQTLLYSASVLYKGNNEPDKPRAIYNELYNNRTGEHE